MQDCVGGHLLSDSLQEFNSLLVGMALEKQGSAKPPQTQQEQIQTRCTTAIAGCRVGIVCCSGGSKQLPLVFCLVMQSPEFLIVGVPFLGRGH